MLFLIMCKYMGVRIPNCPHPFLMSGGVPVGCSQGSGSGDEAKARGLRFKYIALFQHIHKKYSFTTDVFISLVQHFKL